MSQPAGTCERCGAALQPATFFCGECGHAVTPGAQNKPLAKVTMLSASALANSAPASDPAPALVPVPPPPGEGDRTTAAGISEPPRGAMGRTMLGMPHSPLPPPPEPQSGAGAPNARNMGRTMLGMPNAAALQPPAPPAAAGARSTAFARTNPDAGAAPGALVEAAPEAEPKRRTDPQHTLLGLTSDSPPADEPAPAQRDTPTRDRQSTPRVRGDSPDPGSGRKSRSSRSGRSSRASVAGLSSARARTLIIAALLVFSGAVAFGYLMLRGQRSGPDVRVRVVSDAGGESLLFELPGAVAGAKIRFGGQERALEAGRASFPLAADSLRVGKNAVLYDVVTASGVQSGRISLAVDYRVTLDTAPLRGGKGTVDIVISALPGSKVFLDGQEIALDPHGRAVRTDTLELGSASRIDHVVSYRVQPPAGDTSVGELRSSIPVTMMEIDRPGPELVTERDAVEVAGAVDKGAKVSIDGQPVEVVGGRFVFRLPLPEVREYRPEIAASVDGKAPHAETLRVTRVESLADAAKGFTFDAALTYAKIAQNPGIYRGQRVALEGRVYNVSVEAGRSALQMLVRECPKGQRCPMWVSYPAATDFTVDSWVRVLGVLQGEQQFRSETDEIKVVPKVEAAFLLPSKP